MNNMITKTCCALTLTVLTLPVLAGPKVLLETSQGNITLELDAQKAPLTVKNFLQYVSEGFYSGTVFHRVIPGFMVQGGGMDASLQQKVNHTSVKNEANNGLKNLRGTVAMARTSDPNSATSQFYINLNSNGFLDYPGQDGWGYCVFGKVVDGMAAVDKIAALPTGTRPSGFQNVPVDLPIIKRASKISEAPLKP